MKKFIPAIALISVTYAELTFNANNRCTCDDLTTQQDCSKSYPQCIWDEQGSSCSTVTCSSLIDQTNCALNEKCMWSGKGCVEFTFCNQLKGYSQRDCFKQSINCPQSDGKICAGSQALKSCSSYSDQETCDKTISSSGICDWSDSGCSSITSCGQLNSKNCFRGGDACIWNITSNTCTEDSCNQFQSKSTCKYYQTQLDELVFQLCEWDATNSKCNDANDTSALTENTCYNQTLYTHRWSSSSNSCQACEGKIIYMVIMAILIIMI
ncbi:unnamed protein product (macronuclear) [Paramecium tetraurelia]|uniref:Mini antigen n=1 Tax=Paramecium tetraurelia TaxID=5888 RepID=A0EAT0_PARTE|nr:uncharacterized protein GSPATT00025131001 [Paramecium tetraurelia]CAK92397.1 unnamed protein product [Paramecium tetraurelia]|eukprot:XP_001459794.1 hypothetical protein (macronuclear) [Paramecium tetraurelia strain d4-2]